MAAGDSKLEPPAPTLSRRPRISKYMPNLHTVPEELGKSSERIERGSKKEGFFRACIGAHVLHKLNSFPKEAHMAATLLNYMREHGVRINIPICMEIIELKKALTYAAHSSAVKDRLFARKEIPKKLWAGQAAILPWADVKHPQGLWISPLDTITQTGINTRLIYDFSWI